VTGEKNIILEMHASGAALHEVVDRVDRHPGVVINYLVREGVVVHPVSYPEARKALPEMGKQLKSCSLSFANIGGSGFSLADWATYYNKPLFDVFEAAIGGGSEDVRAKLQLDMQVLGERQAEILRANVEFNERMKPVHYYKEVQEVWARLYERQEILPVFFEGEKKQALVSLQITGEADSEIFFRAIVGLTQALAGLLSGKNYRRYGGISDHLPEMYHDQQNPWEKGSNIHIGLEIGIEVNLDVLDGILKSWSNKFCFVLKSFQYVSREFVLSCALDLGHVIEQKLEDGER